MMIYNILSFGLVLSMTGLVFIATRFISSAECNGHGIWHITINALFRGRQDYQNYLKSNSVYLWSVLLVMTLCVMTIALVGAFSHNKIFGRPEIISWAGPIFYLSIIMCFRWFVKKIKEAK